MPNDLKDVPGPESLGEAFGIEDEAAENEAAAIVDRKLDKPTDYTGGDPAAGRVLVINLGFFKYGTSDRFQGAAILMSVILLGLVATLLIASILADIPDNRFDKIFSWLGSAFLLVVGVAIGRATATKDD